MSKAKANENKAIANKVEALKEKGNTALDQEKFQEAIECYTEAINLDPNNHILYSNRSAAYAKNCEYELALKDAEKAIELAPDWSKAYCRKGAALTYLDRLDEAIQTYEARMKVDPDNEQLFDGLKTALTMKIMGRDFKPEGEAMETEPLTDKQLAQQEKQKGNLAYKMKEFDEAIEHYNKAIEYDPTDITFYNNLAAAYFEQKEYEKCIKECEKAIEVGRENRADFKLIAKSLTRIGNAYKRMKDYKNAKIYYEKAMSEHRTPEIKTLLSDVETIIKEEEAKAFVNPELAEKEREMGNELFKKGDYPGAIKHYTEAIKRNPSDPRVYSNRALCYTKLAAFDLGLKDCEKCTELDPKFIRGWIRKGYILLGMHQPDKAMAAFVQAMKLDKDNEEAMQGYRSCILEKSSRREDPEKIRQRAMANPEVQAILKDPAMRIILEQMQNDPQALQEHLKNPEIAAKIQILLESGLIAIH